MRAVKRTKAEHDPIDTIILNTQKEVDANAGLPNLRLLSFLTNEFIESISKINQLASGHIFNFESAGSYPHALGNREPMLSGFVRKSHYRKKKTQRRSANDFGSKTS